MYIPIGREHPAPDLFALPVDLLRLRLEEYAHDIVVCREAVGFALLHSQVYGRGCGRVEGEGVRPYKHRFSAVSRRVASLESYIPSEEDYRRIDAYLCGGTAHTFHAAGQG